jgi:hypothetical protein
VGLVAAGFARQVFDLKQELFCSPSYLSLGSWEGHRAAEAENIRASPIIFGAVALGLVVGVACGSKKILNPRTSP